MEKVGLSLTRNYNAPAQALIFLVLGSLGLCVPLNIMQFEPNDTLACIQSPREVLSSPAIDWDLYHNYTQIVSCLQALNATYPNIVDMFSIGKSWWNRSIYCVRLTNESDLKPKPEVLFVGYHHAQEQISAELPLYFVEYSVTNFGIDETITLLLNGSEIYVIVALNVDGFDLFEVNDWQRKNARSIDEDYDGADDEDPPEDEDEDGLVEVLMNYTDPLNPEFIRWEGTDNDGDGFNAEDWAGGVDLNRNYAIAWEKGVSDLYSSIYRGSAPFSEPETKALRDFVLEHNFMYAISFHSGLELILYPWGSTYDPAPDAAKFLEISQDFSNLTGGTQYLMPDQMGRNYGIWMDWMYGAAGVLPLTLEIFRNETWYYAATGVGPYPNTVWEGGWRWLFNPFPANIENVMLRWLPVFISIANRTISEATHDIAIEHLESPRTVIGKGYEAELKVSVKNEGYFHENVNVTTYANNTILQTQKLILSSENYTTITIMWNTTNFGYGNYTMWSYAEPILDEIDIADNTLILNLEVCISIPGDMDADLDVDIFDIVLIAGGYGSTKGEPDYITNCDIDNDEDVDIFDIVVACEHYGES